MEQNIVYGLENYQFLRVEFHTYLALSYKDMHGGEHTRVLAS